MNQERRRQILAYVLAVVSVAAALATTLLAGQRVVGAESLFFIAVTLSAWYGGLGPGLVASVSASATSTYFFFNPVSGNRIDIDDAVRSLILLTVSILISSLHNAARKSNEQLRLAERASTSANLAKDRFLAALSHELRVPLSPVSTLATIMERDSDLPHRIREDAGTIRRNVELEAHLIDDLLDLNRISIGKLRMQFETLDLHALLNDVVETCRSEANQKSLRIVLHLTSNLHCVRADPLRLRQVFWNLLRNAVKFTPAGGTISISAYNRDDHLFVDVQDSGIGIRPDALGRIFNAFEQADESVTRTYGGLGLGLAISKSLIESHGGHLNAFSEGAGRGATFTVELPVSHDSVRTQSLPRQRLAPRPLHILLVEDHADTAKAMTRLLRHYSHDVQTADSIQSALQAAAANRFDLTISDLGLPDGSGLDLMRELRRQYGLRGIALTGYGTEEDLKLSQDAGFVAHLTKPVDISRLEQVLEEVASGSDQLSGKDQNPRESSFQTHS